MSLIKKATTNYKDNKEFYRSLITLLIPITLQNLLSYILTTTDTLMVGALGEKQLSAVSLANQPFQIYWCIMFGLISGGSILISQYWGKEDIKNINRFTGILFILITFSSLLFAIPAYFFPEWMMSVYSDDAQLIQMGSEYLKLAAFTYLPTGVSGVLLGVLRCTQQAKVPLLVNGISLALNTLLNYMFIFGELGAPEMGIAGAAFATAIARAVEMIIALTFMFVLDSRKIFKIKQMMKIKLFNIKEFFRYALAVLINDVVWGLGISVHAMIIGRLGSEAVAAYTFANIMEKFIFIIIGGMGSAIAVVIGKELGHSMIAEAKKHSSWALRIAITVGVVFSVISATLSPFMITLFNFSDETVGIAMIMIVYMAIISVCKSFNYTVGVGLLRAGGDSKFMAILDILGLYVISIPLSLLAAFVFNLPAYIVYMFLFLDEFIKLFAYFKRYLSKKWARNITVEID